MGLIRFSQTTDANGFPVRIPIQKDKFHASLDHWSVFPIKAEFVQLWPFISYKY